MVMAPPGSAANGPSPNANGFVSTPGGQQGSQSPFGAVTGPNPAYPGSKGVTSYGLFAGPSGGQAPPYVRQPLPPAQSATPPQGYNQPPMQPPNAQYGGNPIGQQPPGRMAPPPGVMTGGMPPRPMSGFQGSQFRSPQIQTPMIPQNLAAKFGGGMAGMGPHAMARQAPSIMQSAPQQAQGQMQAQSRQAQQQPPPSGDDYLALIAKALGMQFAGGGQGQAAAGAAGSLGGQVGAGAGQDVGQTAAGFINSFDKAMGSGQYGPSYTGTVAGNMPGFQDSSLTNAAAQDAMQMADPQAWQQMGQDRLAQDSATNLASLNLGERRMNDQAGRTGFANPGGALGNLYHQYGLQQSADQRNVQNDILNGQMSAFNQLGQFSQGMRGQDLSRWGQLANFANQAGTADVNAYRQDNPSGGQVLQDALGAGGQAAGGLASAGGGLMGLLGMLAMGG